MKIAQFIASDGWGGAENVFLDLCNALAQEHEVTAISYINPSAIKTLSPRVRYIHLPRTSRHNPRAYLTLYRLFKKERFDIVHSHSAKASEIIYRLSRILPFRQVATKHNARKGPVFEKVRHVTAVSNAVAKSIQHDATVIYNGIVPQTVNVQEGRHDPFRITAIGRLDPIKGFDHLIEAAGRLPIAFQLEIIGDGPQKEELECQIEKCGMTEHVRLAGYCENIPGKMSSSDLVIISSHSEGFPLVLVESLFYAKVMISTPVGGCSEILSPTLLVEPDRLTEKIEEVAKNYTVYRNCFRDVQEQNQKRFLMETVAQAYIDFYGTIYGQN